MGIMFANLSLSVLFALAVAFSMVAVVAYILIAHDRNHEKFEEWLDFSFSSHSLHQALGYYRLIAVSMLFAYVLFTTSAVWLRLASRKGPRPRARARSRDAFNLAASDTSNRTKVALPAFCFSRERRVGSIVRQAGHQLA